VAKKQQENELEVLFKWQEYKNISRSKQSQLLDKITENVISIFSPKSEVLQVHTLQSSRQAASRGKQKKYLLQCYINDWKTYVNVDSLDQAKNCDYLTIMTLQPGSVLSILSSTESWSLQKETKV